MKKGACGPAVTFLQERLNDHGAGLVEDGIFGPKTKAAVKQFQLSRDLDVDGIVGPITWGALTGAGGGGGAAGTQPAQQTDDDSGTGTDTPANDDTPAGSDDDDVPDHGGSGTFNPDEDFSAQLDNARIDLNEAVQLSYSAGSADSDPDLIERAESLLDQFDEMVNRLDEADEPDETVLRYLGQLQSLNKAIRNLDLKLDLFVKVTSGSSGDPLAGVEVMVKTAHQELLTGSTKPSGMVKFTGVQTPQTVKVLAIGEKDRREKEFHLTAPSNGEFITVDVIVGDPDPETQKKLLMSMQNVLVADYEANLRKAHEKSVAYQKKIVEEDYGESIPGGGSKRSSRGQICSIWWASTGATCCGRSL